MMMKKAGAVGQIAHIIRAMEGGGETQIVVKSWAAEGLSHIH
jgi:hypothetical protein